MERVRKGLFLARSGVARVVGKALKDDMEITDYHAKYYAHELGRTGGSGIDRLGRALFDACVDLNPHQIEAALFALGSPFFQDALWTDFV